MASSSQDCLNLQRPRDCFLVWMNFPFLVIGEMTPILFDNICLFLDVGSWFMIATFLMWFFNLLGLEDKQSMEGQIPEPNDTQGRNSPKTMIGEVGDLFF